MVNIANSLADWLLWCRVGDDFRIYYLKLVLIWLQFYSNDIHIDIYIPIVTR